MKKKMKLLQTSLRLLKQILLNLSVVFFLIGIPLKSFAQGTCRPLISSYTIDYGDIYIQRDTPNGQAVSNVIYGAKQNAYSCDFQAPDGIFVGIKSILQNSGFSIGNGVVFKTNIPGVGVQIGGSGWAPSGGPWSCYIAEGCYGYSGANWQGLGGIIWDGTGWWYNNILTLQPYFRLIKIGQAQSGTLQGQIGAGISSLRNPSLVWQPEIPIYFGSGKVTVLACSITTPNLTFPIGDVLASNFSNTVGTIPNGAQNTQNLGLNCDARANINVMLQGTQNPDVSATSVLALTSQGNADVAKGVGVQLLYNGVPLIINNRIVLKKSAGGQETFPITARYYQTKTSVSTGKANTSATLDITYQ